MNLENISPHTCNVYGEKMVLVGGSSEGSENDEILCLDLKNFQWDKFMLKNNSQKDLEQ